MADKQREKRENEKFVTNLEQTTPNTTAITFQNPKEFSDFILEITRNERGHVRKYLSSD